MQIGLDRLIGHVERAVVWLAAAGAMVILVQMVWITYGVFTRYALNSPDRTVTEATALLLFPVAFVGLAYAMREDAYPRVTMLTDILPDVWRKAAAVINLCIMLAVGLFLSLTGVSATVRSFNSGASSEILLWPRYAFWAPGALALVLFSIYAALRLIRLLQTPATEV